MWRPNITHAEQHPSAHLTYIFNLFCTFTLVSRLQTHCTSCEPCRLVNLRFPVWMHRSCLRREASHEASECEVVQTLSEHGDPVFDYLGCIINF